MRDFKKRKIRILFYTCGILSIVIISAFISIPHFIQLKKWQNENIEQFSKSIMQEKRHMLADVINGFFLEIDFIKQDTYKKYSDLSVELSGMLYGYLNCPAGMAGNPYATVESIVSNSAGDLFNRTFCVLIVDKDSGNPVYLSPQAEKIIGSVLPDLTDKNLYPILSQRSVGENIVVYVFMTAQQVYNVVEDRVRGALKAFHYSNGGYIWVNKIINYAGGDAYACRIIHPNLPKTEGLMLSTSMQDIKGNLPYLAELEGIKSHGELYFEYYFKREDSEEISRKLTFAKLYKPYDWVVATGIYLDDAEEVLEKNYEQQIINFSLIIVVIVISLIFLLSFFEKRVCLFIDEFISKIKEGENELIKEKNTMLSG